MLEPQARMDRMPVKQVLAKSGREAGGQQERFRGGDRTPDSVGSTMVAVAE